jgi:hypothetical protein
MQGDKRDHREKARRRKRKERVSVEVRSDHRKEPQRATALRILGKEGVTLKWRAGENFGKERRTQGGLIRELRILLFYVIFVPFLTTLIIILFILFSSFDIF